MTEPPVDPVVADAENPPTPDLPLRGGSLTADAWRRLRRNRFAVAGAAFLGLLVVLCFVGPAVFDVDHGKTNAILHDRPPGAAHWLGTDALGRDYFARVLVGGRTSLLIGLAAALVVTVIGTLFGAVAGYYGGRVDEAMMRFVDFLYGIPYMFLVILMVLMLPENARASPVPMFLGLGLVQWLTMARIVRGQVLSLREREFVLAAKTMGASGPRIILRHILPNCVGVIVVYATLTVPAVILLESFLSYLGLGVDISWGRLVAEGVQVVNPVRIHWWLPVFPTALLLLTLLSLNFLGDGLRDALDPKTRR